jgi:hypothetical protein
MGKSFVQYLLTELDDGKFFRTLYLIWLVVWNMAFMTFHILGIVTPTDELIFFRGVGIPPTRYI